MCFGRISKSTHQPDDHVQPPRIVADDDDDGPAGLLAVGGQPPGKRQSTSSKTAVRMPSNQFAPPPGPPPPGPPPPARKNHNNDPSWSQSDPPPYHDWAAAIPDTALLPPPPVSGYDDSPTSNAPESEADRATAWTRRYPLQGPRPLGPDELRRVRAGDIDLGRPAEYVGDLIRRGRPGAWRGRTGGAGTRDACLLSTLPVYSVPHDSPVRTGQTKTIYFEVRVHSVGGGEAEGAEASLSLGYCAHPYPTFRMPGWQRGSLAVHADDGRRYVNDQWGGKDFTAPFAVGGHTVGIGMIVHRPSDPPAYHHHDAIRDHGGYGDGDDGRPPASTTTTTTTTTTPPLPTEAFFTRDGERVGGWQVQEELDAATDLGVEGLAGDFDLYAAVGVFGARLDFEVLFHEADWLYRP